MITLGLLTVGQAPRADVTPGIMGGFGRLFQVLQSGALDDLETEEGLGPLAPVAGRPRLVSRLRTGQAVVVDQEAVLPRLRQAAGRLEKAGAYLLILLCTGDLSGDISTVPVLRPGPMMKARVASLAPRRLGVVVPLPEQQAAAAERWQTREDGLVEAASPYGPPEAVAAAGRRLRRHRPDVVILDCLGYGQAASDLVREALPAAVVLYPQAEVRCVLQGLAGVHPSGY